MNSSKTDNRQSLLQVKIKSNGHSIYNKIVEKLSVIDEISYHLNHYKLPINININQSALNNHNNSMKDTLRVQTYREQKQTEVIRDREMQEGKEEYQLAVLTEQIHLFETDKQIQEYVAMEKLLAHDVQAKMTKLAESVIRILKQKIKEDDTQDLAKILTMEQLQATNITKQKLNQIQEKCMTILNRVQEERRKIELCAICWDRSSSIIFIPCMHLVLCKKCPVPKKCPICKSIIEKSSPIYR